MSTFRKLSDTPAGQLLDQLKRSLEQLLETIQEHRLVALRQFRAIADMHHRFVRPLSKEALEDLDRLIAGGDK